MEEKGRKEGQKEVIHNFKQGGHGGRPPLSKDLKEGGAGLLFLWCALADAQYLEEYLACSGHRRSVLGR